MAHLASLISDLALLLIVAGLTTLLCKRFNQPVVLGYILAGFLVGPVVDFLPTVADTENIEIWAEIGVIFLMFAIGLEFSIHKLVKVGSSGLLAVIAEIFGMLSIGYLIGLALGWTHMDSLFLGGMLSVSSTMITIKAINDLGMSDQPFVQLAIGTLVMEDIAAVFMMIILSTIAVSIGISGAELISSIGLLLFYLVIWLLVGILVIPSFLKKVDGLLNNETLLIVALGICFGMVWLGTALGFSAALGAFMAGSILASTTYAEKIEHLITPCKDLFVAVFFVSVGLLVDPAMIVTYIVPIILISIATIIGKIITVTCGLLLGGEELSTSVHASFSLTQIGEFSFIIATLGLSLGVISDFVYPIIVAVSVITTLTTPFSLKRADGFCRLLYKVLPKRFIKSLERYTVAKKSENSQGDQDWRRFIKKFFTSIFLYGTIVAGICLIGVEWLHPLLIEHTTVRIANVITCLVIYICSVPFIPPLLVFRRRYFTALWLKSFANRLPLILLLILRISIGILLLTMPPVMIYDIPIYWSLVLAVPLAYLLSRSDKLFGSYLQIEAKFLSNFNERQLNELKAAKGDQDHHWLNEQLVVSEFCCPPDSPIIGQSLIELNWDHKQQVKIIKIIRNKHHINIPLGNEVIKAGDILYAMGSARHLENFRIISDRRSELTQNITDQFTLKQFIDNQEAADERDQLLCCAISLPKDSPQVGKSIKESSIKEEWSCFLIGLERNLLPIINPHPNQKLQAEDLLWVLGGQKMGYKLLQADLL